MKVALVMALCNGPIAVVLALDILQGSRSGKHAERALAKGVCQAGSRWLPGHRCGQPTTATLELYEGYEYRFFQCLCDEHEVEARRRMRGTAYRVNALASRDS
jgi:hypothetical protein